MSQEHTERLAAELALLAKKQVAAKAFEPFVKSWCEKTLEDMLALSEAVAMDAASLAMAGIYPALSAGWEVSAMVSVVKAALQDADAKVAQAGGTEDEPQQLAERTLMAEACKLSLARAFATVDTYRVLHGELVRIAETVQKAQSESGSPS